MRRAIYYVIAGLVCALFGWSLTGVIIALAVIAGGEWHAWRERQEELAWLQRNAGLMRAHEEQVRMQVEWLEEREYVYNGKRGCWIRPDGSEYTPEPIEPPNYI